MAASLQNQTLAVRIVKKIAAREDVDPEELTPRLSTVIDTEAIEGLFEGKDRVGGIEFEYRGYRVWVDSEKNVEITSEMETSQ